MATYKAPLRDMRFVLYELHRGDALAHLPGFEEMTPDLIDPILDEAAKLCEEVLFPLNRPGDEHGCVFENGVVRTPKGFQEAYRTFRESAWTSIACDPAYGGQGLPHSVATLIDEMICSSNLSFGLYPGLSYGAYVALHAHGSEALKDIYLPKLVEGVWSGTMCLTEPHCGTDIALLRTRAVPQDDGSYRITGTKIFVSAGDHDLTENIVHLVLARRPDAPPGIGGVSLFLVPKYLVGDDGSLGARNGVACGSIEHKMGIKASATCVINFDDATGWLVGEPHKGMRAMFTMMNTERLAVGIQGLSLAEASYQGAVAHARERLQGRALSGSKHPDKAADPIIVHPDVRRMLLTQRAYIEGCRALGGWVAHALDEQHCNPDPDRRAAAEDLVALLTPTVKALFTDLGFEATNLGLQVLGGHGYIREQGMEQYVRDCRITQIYEGTKGVLVSVFQITKGNCRSRCAVVNALEDPRSARVCRVRHAPVVRSLEQPLRGKADAAQHLRRPAIAAPQTAISAIQHVVILARLARPGADTPFGAADFDDIWGRWALGNAPVEPVAAEIG